MRCLKFREWVRVTEYFAQRRRQMSGVFVVAELFRLLLPPAVT